MRSGLKGLLVTLMIGIAPHIQNAFCQDYQFSWDRATVYSVTILPAGDTVAPGRETSIRPNETAAANVLFDPAGADLAELTARLDEGYFNHLGVDVLSVTPLYNRRPTGTISRYWSSDFATVDPILGSPDDVKSLVDAAHGQGIRVIMAVELPMPSMEFRLDSTDEGSGPDLSLVFQEQWGAEKAAKQVDDLRSFLANYRMTPNPSIVAVKWLADWVRTYGIDGFRVFSPDRLDGDIVAVLKAECRRALIAWKSEHPGQSLDPQEFWMIADPPDHTFERSSYFDIGFNAVTVNRYGGTFPGVDSTFAALSSRLTADPTFNVLTTVSTGPGPLFATADQITAGTNLMLLPGLVQVIFGEEKGREIIPRSGSVSAFGGEATDWDVADPVISEHWNKLGTFRKRHPAIAAGAHIKLSDDPYVFYRGMRIGSRMDEVIVVLGASGRVRINVSQVFPDDTVLREAYTGAISIVSYGEVQFQVGENQVLLLEPVE